MFMRRRPLLRTAVIGGGAYVAGKKSAQRSADQAQQGQQQAGEQDEHAAGAGQQQPTASDQLEQLSTLHQQGALTDSEFTAAKARLLGS